MPPANPSSPQAAPTPVFVDDTGRRHRTVRVIGWVLGAVMLAYLALLGISLVGSPGVVPLSLPAIGRLLPGPAAPLINGPSSVASRPGDLVASTVSAAGGISRDAGSPSRSAPQPGAAQPTSAPHPSASPAARPRPRPTTVPTSAGTPAPARTPQGNPSPNGSPRATHTPSSHPSPKSTRRTAHSPKPSPTPSPSAT